MDKVPKAEKRTAAYVDETFHLLQAQPGVKDVIILNHMANPIRTTMSQVRAVEYCGYYDMMYQKVKYILQQLDIEDELLSLRVRTKWDETLVSQDGKITLMVIQNAEDMTQRLIKKLPDKKL